MNDRSSSQQLVVSFQSAEEAAAGDKRLRINVTLYERLSVHALDKYAAQVSSISP